VLVTTALNVHVVRLNLCLPRIAHQLSNFSSTDSTFKKILANPRASQRVRIAALKAMCRPSLLLLMRLERDPDTPPKIKFAVAQRRAAEMLIRKASNATMDTAREQDNTPSYSR
jgi:hypothetical protein